MSTASDPLVPPDATLVNRRWIPEHVCTWAKQAHAIMLEHGSVRSSRTYDRRHQARWGAQYLIEKLVQLDLCRRGQLSEHTERTSDGWIWTVEYRRKEQHD